MNQLGYVGCFMLSAESLITENYLNTGRCCSGKTIAPQNTKFLRSKENSRGLPVDFVSTNNPSGFSQFAK